ncbi:MAG TPA: hypothetical protein PKU94_07230 [Candidatus Hydrothermia bacterium]|nr:hypothetical protein [Candidatus Hydrothermia bacterium]
MDEKISLTIFIGGILNIQTAGRREKNKGIPTFYIERILICEIKHSKIRKFCGIRFPCAIRITRN